MLAKTITKPQFSPIGSNYSWDYNVRNDFKNKTQEQIKQALKDTALPFSMCVENWQYNINISSAARNFNAFNGTTFYYVGLKRLDKRGMCGVQNYTDIQWISTVNDLIALKSQYRFVGLDNIDGSVCMSEYKWAPNSLIILGCESLGLTSQMISLCDDLVSIPQLGSVRSLNAAVASGIAMYDYATKYKQK